MFTKKTIIIMLVVIGAALIFIVGITLWEKYYRPNAAIPANQGKTGQASSTAIADGKQETEKLIDEIKNGDNNGQSAGRVVDLPGAGQAVQAAPGSSAVAVDTGKVTTLDGKEANNNAAPGTLNAPQESFAVDPSALPPSTVKLLVTDTSITPAEFTVHPGQAVVIAVTAGPKWTEVFTFEDPALAAVTIGVGPNETRSITFNAPMAAGEYIYFSSLGNHRLAGSAGKMIVQ